MNLQKRLFANVLVCILVLASLTGCGTSSSSDDTQTESTETTSSDSTVITLGYLPITHALTIFEEKELLDKEDDGITIELKKFSSWSDLTDALNSGSIDGASVLIELAMSAKSQNIDLKAVALGHKDGNVIVSSEDIESAEDLKGKRIAIPHTQSSHNILIQDELAKAGLTTDDVEIIQLSPTEMPSSLASGSIDAYCVAEPFGAQAVAQGFGKVLDTSEDLWEDSLCCGLVMNNASIEKIGEDKISTFIEKYYEAGKALDTEEAKSIAENYLGQNADVLDTSLKWIKYDDLEITEEAYSTLVKKVKEYGINDNPPSYEEFVYQATK